MNPFTQKRHLVYYSFVPHMSHNPNMEPMLEHVYFLSFELQIFPLRNKQFYPKSKKPKKIPFKFKINPIVVIYQ
jgi:hypothetical protein